MGTEYQINLNFKDYLAILFRWNKRCPICSNKVTRKIERTVIDKGRTIERQGHNIEIGDRHKHSVKVRYVCNTCGKFFSPREFW